MSIAPSPQPLTADDLAARFGKMPAWRIRTNPEPGTATEADAIWIQTHEDRTCELVDGILVEKDVSAEASLIAIWIATMLNNFIQPRKLGFVLGEQGLLRLSSGRLRAPDVSFIRRDQTPSGRFPTQPVPKLYPTLAVEVLSPGNTAREIDEKLDDYFDAGCELVWIVDPKSKTIRVLARRDEETTLGADGLLDGGEVLPGFSVPVVEIFAAMELGEEV